MGTNVIIDAFLVVVVGGIGQLKGSRDRRLRARRAPVGHRVLDHRSASPRCSSSWPSSRSCSGGPRACSPCGPGAWHERPDPAPRRRSGARPGPGSTGSLTGCGWPPGFARRGAAVRGSPRRSCPTSGSTCWPSTCASRSSRSASAWPGAGAACSPSARASSSASAATRWRCTSSSPTPAPASCPTSCSSTARWTSCRCGGRPFASPVFALRGRVAAADAGGVRCSGSLVFRRRVRGAYFAILSQALAAALAILLIGQQGTTGGTNGMTDIQSFFGYDLRRPGQPADGVLHHRRRAAGAAGRWPGS